MLLLLLYKPRDTDLSLPSNMLDATDSVGRKIGRLQRTLSFQTK